MKKFILFTAALATTTALIAGNKLSKLKAPTENQGITMEVLGSNELASQIPAFEGYEIRARKITFAPGATLMPHSHATRPGFVYILSGEVVESRNGTARTYKAGEMWIEDANTDHWMRNVSNEPAVFIMVDTPVQE